MRTKKQAARELNEIYNFYEVRKNSLKTTYNKIFKDIVNGNWRLIGYAHDYTIQQSNKYNNNLKLTRNRLTSVKKL